LAALDLFGIALVTGAVRDGADLPAVIALLRRTSGIDRLLAGIERVEAVVRYRRLMDALPRLTELAAASEPVAEFLAGDDVVLARSAAAADVIRAAGMAVDGCMVGGAAADPLSAAVFWQHYSRGPVLPMHRACGADIARGLLRLRARE